MPSAKRPRPGTRRGRSSLSSRRLLPPAAILLIALGVVARAPAHAAAPDPFAFFQPTVVLTAGERKQLERGEPLVRVIPGEDREVAVFAAMKTTIDGDRLLAWVQRIEALKKNAYVLAISRFSETPRLEDLKGLTLEEDEASDILDCRPGDCSLKLSGDEMRTLQQAAARQGSNEAPKNAALERAYQSVMLRRIEKYLAGGLAGLPNDESTSDALRPADALAALLDHTRFLSAHTPTFAQYLSHFPRAPMPGVESFVYWSKEQIAGKPIVSATHVSTLRSDVPGVPEGLAATVGIFSTHYVNASLGVMAVVREAPGAPGYLVYMNRSQVDVLGGMFGGLVRMVVQRRLRSEATDVLRDIRKRLESGVPPAGAAASETQR
jgi:hypothetical protein